MHDQIQEGYVRSEHLEGITTIEFYHPQSNSLPGRLLEAMTRAVETAGKNRDTRVIVLQSAGDRTFCAGASFDELLAIETPEQGLNFFSGFAHLINAMRNCPKFILLRVQGKCVGGGVGVAAAADYVIAVEGADVKLSELAIGIGPFVVGPAVERKIGVAHFGTLAIDATRWRNAEWAKEKGLFSELHPDAVAMDESVRRLAGHLAHSNPEAMALLKQHLWRGTEHWEQLLIERAAMSGRLVLSPFSRQAISALRPKK